MPTNKYITIVIRADDEKAARSLVPGVLVLGNPVVACSLGHALRLNDKLNELIQPEQYDQADALYTENTAAFYGR